MPVASGVNRYLKINSHKIPQLFSRYYNSVPERVINNRLEVDFADFTTPEYANYDKDYAEEMGIVPRFGLQLCLQPAEGPEQVIPDQLVWLLFQRPESDWRYASHA